MTEAVITVNDDWFDVLRFPVLRAPEAVANVASLRISEKPVCVLLPPLKATMFRVDSQRKTGKLQRKNSVRRD